MEFQNNLLLLILEPDAEFAEHVFEFVDFYQTFIIRESISFNCREELAPIFRVIARHFAMNIVVQSQDFLLVLLQVWHAVQSSADNTRPAPNQIASRVLRLHRSSLLLPKVKGLAWVNLETNR